MSEEKKTRPAKIVMWVILLMFGGCTACIVTTCGAVAVGVANEKGERSRELEAYKSGERIPDVEVDAATLFMDYEGNEIGADARYKNKWLLITGTVDSVAKDITDTPYITLDCGNMIFTVQCFLADTSMAGSLKKGQRVTIIGRCSGKFGNVLVKDGVLK